MPRIAYETMNFRAATLLVIDKANQILREYAGQGYDLTLRQLYYQFVARDLIPNSDREYKKLGDIVNNARLGGLIDWNHITDRTRYVRTPPSWETPEDIVRGAAQGYSIDLHKEQDVHIEVWVEKDALAGVIDRACEEYRVAWLSCRGYMSQSEMWTAARRFGRHLSAGRRVMVLHLGDHDPSGIDMSRDIRDRCQNFLAGDGHSPWDGAFDLRRIALTMDQVEQYDPPPNPAKITDSRSDSYIDRYGESSWELDALEPSDLDALIQEHVSGLLDLDVFEEAKEQEEHERENLTAISDNYAAVVKYLSEQS